MRNQAIEKFLMKQKHPVVSRKQYAKIKLIDCLLQEWNDRQKRLENAKWGDEDDNSKDGSEEDEDDIPFACYICRKPWTELRDPVVTRCKHYFCEACALRHNALNKSKCAVCEQPTNGIFNVAYDIVKKVKEQKRTGAGDP